MRGELFLVFGSRKNEEESGRKRMKGRGGARHNLVARHRRSPNGSLRWMQMTQQTAGAMVPSSTLSLTHNPHSYLCPMAPTAVNGVANAK